MAEPTIVVAACGCRFKIVSSSPEHITGALELDAICVLHSQARTAYLVAKERAHE